MEEPTKKHCCCHLPNGIWALICVVVLGCFMLLSIRTLKSYDHTISVRGLCEREVMADRAIYPIVYKETGNDLTTLYTTINEKNKQIVEFLKTNGFTDDEITIGAPELTDNFSNSYSENAHSRYVLSSTITVYTSKVQQVVDVQTKQVDLLAQGVAIGSNSWEHNVEFEFEGLNTIKPEMIEEANKNARTAAEQFAKDSDSQLGKITSAEQGLFSIEPRDSQNPQIKRIRVITYVTYNLK